MAANKRIDVICIVITLVALIITVLFINGQSLGLQVYVGNEETSEKNSHFSSSDMKTEVNTEDATEIEFSEDTVTISGNGAYYANGVLNIVYKGTYVLRGSYNGQIKIDVDGDDKVWLVLDGFSIYCEDSAAIYIKKADKVFLNLTAGSVNSIECGNEFSDEAVQDKIKAALFSKEDLTINGTGTLSVVGGYAHGIVCKDKLKITGGDISVKAKSDGIHVKDAVFFTEAKLVVSANDDAVTVGNDDNTQGELYICSGSIEVTNAYEGIEAYNILLDGGDLKISSKDDGINATSKDSGTGITINNSSIEIINSGGRDADGIDSNMDIVINGGRVFVSVPSDGNALDPGSESGGKIFINGGNVIACGGTMMAQAPDATGTQVSFMYSVQGNAGDTIRLETSQGQELFAKTIANSFSALTVSLPDLKSGETYKLINGDQITEVVLTDTVTSNIQSGGFGGGPGGGPGGSRPGGSRPSGSPGSREGFSRPNTN